MLRRLLTLSAAAVLLALPARGDEPKKPDPVVDNQAAKPAKDAKDPKKGDADANESGRQELIENIINRYYR